MCTKVRATNVFKYLIAQDFDTVGQNTLPREVPEPIFEFHASRSEPIYVDSNVDDPSPGANWASQVSNERTRALSCLA